MPGLEQQGPGLAQPMFAAPAKQELGTELSKRQPEAGDRVPILGEELLQPEQAYIVDANLSVTRTSGKTEDGWRLGALHGDSRSEQILATVIKTEGDEAGAEKTIPLSSILSNNWPPEANDDTVSRDIILKLRADSRRVREDGERIVVPLEHPAEEVSQIAVSRSIKVEDVSGKMPDLVVELDGEQESNVRESGNLVDDPIFKELLSRFEVGVTPDDLRQAVANNSEFAEALDGLLDARLVELNDVWRDNHAIEDEYFELVEDPSYTDYLPGHRPQERATIHNMRPPERFGNFLGSGQRKNHPITGENLSSRQHIKNIARDYITGEFDYKREGTDPVVGRVYKHFREPKGFVPGRIRPRRYQVTLGSHRSVAQLLAYGQVAFDEIK